MGYVQQPTLQRRTGTMIQQSPTNWKKVKERECSLSADEYIEKHSCKKIEPITCTWQCAQAVVGCTLRKNERRHNFNGRPDAKARLVLYKAVATLDTAAYRPLFEPSRRFLRCLRTQK